MLRKMADFSERVRVGAVDGPHRPAHPQRREHRHRRLRPRPGDGLRGAARLLAARHDVPVRVQRRRHRLLGVRCTTSTRPRRCSSSASKTFTTLETLTNAHTRPRLAAGRTRWATTPAVAKHFVAVSTNADEVREVRHRHRQHVRVLGLGRRPLLLRLGHRPVADDRDRPRAVRRDARRLPRDGRALPHRAVRAEPAGAPGPDRHLVRRLLRRRDPGDPAVQPVPRPVPRVPPAARHGERRQVGRPRRQPGRPCRPVRSCGASPARTASTRTTS